MMSPFHKAPKISLTMDLLNETLGTDGAVVARNHDGLLKGYFRVGRAFDRFNPPEGLAGKIMKGGYFHLHHDLGDGGPEITMIYSKPLDDPSIEPPAALLILSSERTTFDRHSLRLIEDMVFVISRQIASVTLDTRLEELESDVIELSEIIDTAGDAIIITDEGGRIRSFNKAAERMFGADFGNVKGETLESLVIEKSGGNFVGIRSGSEEFPVEVSFSTVRIGDKTLLSAIIRDLTQRQRYENELLKLPVAIDQSSGVVFITDPEGNIEYVNRKFTEVTGYYPSDVIGRNPRILKSGDLSREVYEKLWETLKSGREWRGEFRNRTKEGGYYWALASISPIRNEEGEITNFIAIQEDITERKAMEEGLRKATEKALEASNAKSTFLATMSHELRTPLNSIIGFANILRKKEGEVLGPKEISYLDRVVSNGLHLLDIINGILDLSKIESGKLELASTSLDLTILIRETLSEMEVQTEGKPVKLVADLPESPAVIETDPSKLKQVIINLVGNALKFTHEGAVTVRVNLSGERPVAIEVEDTGIGIAPEGIHRVFDAFVQADSGTKRKYGGSGLGLAITRALLDKMGYSISVRSELGKGTVFTINLSPDIPAEEIRPPRAETRPRSKGDFPGDPPPFSGLRIGLLVTDDDTRDLVSSLLKDLGADVRSDPTGRLDAIVHDGKAEFEPGLPALDISIKRDAPDELMPPFTHENLFWTLTRRMGMER